MHSFTQHFKNLNLLSPITKYEARLLSTPNKIDFTITSHVCDILSRYNSSSAFMSDIFDLGNISFPFLPPSNGSPSVTFQNFPTSLSAAFSLALPHFPPKAAIGGKKERQRELEKESSILAPLQGVMLCEEFFPGLFSPRFLRFLSHFHPSLSLPDSLSRHVAAAAAANKPLAQVPRAAAEHTVERVQ